MIVWFPARALFITDFIVGWAWDGPEKAISYISRWAALDTCERDHSGVMGHVII